MNERLGERYPSMDQETQNPRQEKSFFYSLPFTNNLNFYLRVGGAALSLAYLSACAGTVPQPEQVSEPTVVAVVHPTTEIFLTSTPAPTETQPPTPAPTSTSLPTPHPIESSIEFLLPTPDATYLDLPEQTAAYVLAYEAMLHEKKTAADLGEQFTESDIELVRRSIVKLYYRLDEEAVISSCTAWVSSIMPVDGQFLVQFNTAIHCFAEDPYDPHTSYIVPRDMIITKPEDKIKIPVSVDPTQVQGWVTGEGALVGYDHASFPVLFTAEQYAHLNLLPLKYQEGLSPQPNESVLIAGYSRDKNIVPLALEMTIDPTYSRNGRVSVYNPRLPQLVLTSGSSGGPGILKRDGELYVAYTSSAISMPAEMECAAIVEGWCFGRKNGISYNFYAPLPHMER